ncbi:hypothetical protein COY90_03960 [Candidatus Roizmanbacteria bacterium CG_4_10_14_0_8_um_filter_39_9]|uniref:Lactamase n=1 Tax=Candidatus Roizmanbacteria bacterium CG_4_10_14_0_8_um_filter_39_9 TaxID=1974829 RepID=A0A2M7QC49_9BACT|nr:MAG: hypothetical protein COY90_03960 [Candidatus Roizmanbacteria bacterium CG_4_10_14_0_8_um_filter_39_9]
MEIKYLGHSSFFIKTKDAKIVMDPFDPKIVGLKFPKIEADIVTVSHHHKDHDQTGSITGTPLILDWPGQFEKKGVRVWGFGTYHDKTKGSERGANTMFKFESEGVSVLHCGDLGQMLDDAFLEEVGDVDVLLVPVGGFYTIDATEAIELIKKVEPSIVVPMHYNKGDWDVSNKELAPLSDFLKKIGSEGSVPVDKLVIKREDLEEEMKIVVMKVS